MKNIITIIIMILVPFILSSQDIFNEYKKYYPIGENPTISYMTSYDSKEPILFEANPIVRYSITNNFIKGLINGERHQSAYYFSVRPQLRMYNNQSKPVRMPSYKILLGTQHMYLLNSSSEYTKKFFAFSFETGHYSNGQDGCAFSTSIKDGTAECEDVYSKIDENTNLSNILNRSNGNFSTNLTELILNYKIINLDDNDYPSTKHSFEAGLLYYHDKLLGLLNIGGYSDNDIKIYGNLRFLLGYEYMWHLNMDEKYLRVSFKQNLELISGAHNHVNPIRSVSSLRIFPFAQSKEFGFILNYTFGHDNYNYRFVDSGHVLSIGLVWDMIPDSIKSSDE